MLVSGGALLGVHLSGAGRSFIVVNSYFEKMPALNRVPRKKPFFIWSGASEAPCCITAFLHPGVGPPGDIRFDALERNIV